MEKIKNAIPKLMEVRWLSEACAFVITFSPIFIEQLEIWFKNPGLLIADFLKRNKNFRFDFSHKSEGIGLNGRLIHWNDLFFQSDYSFYYKVPALSYFSDEPCEDCNGTRVKYSGWNGCFGCRQTGKKVESDVGAQENFHDFGMTMYILSRLMHSFALDWNEYKDTKKIHVPKNFADQQTMLFQISEKIGMCKAYMGAWLHNEVIKRVWEFDEKEDNNVRDAMYSVESKLHLMVKRESDMMSFRLNGNISTGNFWLEVPGSACTLGVEGDGLGNSWGWGKILSPHNIDHRTAQISFLAGLAKLDELALKRIQNANNRE